MFRALSTGRRCSYPITRRRSGEGRPAKEAMDRCKQWLERGVPVIFFSEGTRSPDGKMGPFRDGAFRLALDNGAQIIPIGVCGTRRALPKHSWKFGFARALVEVGTPIPTTGRDASDWSPSRPRPGRRSRHCGHGCSRPPSRRASE